MFYGMCCLTIFVFLFILFILHAALDVYKDTENIKLVFCAVKDTIMQSALKEFNLAWVYANILSTNKYLFLIVLHVLLLNL